MKRLLCLLLVPVLLVSLAAGCASAPEEETEAEPVRIGVKVPLSGSSAATGIEMRNAYILARDEINDAGGVLGGRPLELVFEDGKDAEAAVAALEKFVTRENIEIILGGVSSTCGYAIAEPAKRHEPLLAWTGAASSLVEEAFGDAAWFFHYHPWEYHNVKALADFLQYVGAKKVAIAYEDGLFGTSNIEICREVLGALDIEIVTVQSFVTGSPDFTPLLTMVKGTNPEVFIWIGYPGDAVPIVTQCKEIDFNPKNILAYVPGWPEGYKDLPEGMLVTAIQVSQPDVADATAQEFVQAYTAKFNEPPRSYWAPLAYTNLVTVAAAIERAGSTEKSAVIAALEQTDYKSPLGWTLQFKPSKICRHQGFTELVTVQWINGKMEVVFPEQLATADLIYPVPKWKDR